jgi:uncharacterized protein
LVAPGLSVGTPVIRRNAIPWSGQILNDESDDPVFIPYSELSPDVLQRLIESFVLREGTDYGERPFTLEEKVAHVIGELRHGTAQISFDPSTASITIQRVD